MFILIVGCGRVGSSVARDLLKEGHEVSCLDEDPESHAGWSSDWIRAGRTSAASSPSAPRWRWTRCSRRGSSKCDAFIAATDGDNTNIIVAQVAQKRYNVPTVVARILDPYRAEWYEHQGVHTICPTKVAIEMLENDIRAAAEKHSGAATAG